MTLLTLKAPRSERYEWFRLDYTYTAKQHIIYQAVNKIDGKKYFGYSSRANLQERLSEHHGNAFTLKQDKFFYRALRKYGWNNFVWTIVDSTDTQEEAFKKEIFYISFFDTMNPDKGYNMSAGGEGHSGWVMSEERRQALSDLHSIACYGKNLWTDEIKEFKSFSEAANFIGVNQAALYRTYINKEWVIGYTLEELVEKEQIAYQKAPVVPYYKINPKTFKSVLIPYEEVRGCKTPNILTSSVKATTGGYYFCRKNQLNEALEFVKELEKSKIKYVAINLYSFEVLKGKETKDIANLLGCRPELISTKTAKGKTNILNRKFLLFQASPESDLDNVIENYSFQMIEEYDLEGNLTNVYRTKDEAFEANPTITNIRMITRVLKGERKSTDGKIFKEVALTRDQYNSIRSSLGFTKCK